MPKASLTPSSQQIEVSFSSTAVAAGYTSKRIDLQLNPLDQEVFVVTAVKVDLDPIGSTPLNLFGAGAVGTNKLYGGSCALTRTESAAALANLGQNTCFATASSKLGTSEESQAGGDYAVSYAFQENNSDTPTDLDYLAIIATNDFFVGLQAMQDGSVSGNMDVHGKVYGYRAKASAAIYAALVQSEVLSN